MPKLNENFLKLQESYLFSEIAHRVAEYTKKYPEKEVIRLGIGDVTRPLCDCAVQALHEGADAMASAETFKGYGPEQGYAETKRRNRGILSEKWCRSISKRNFYF